MITIAQESIESLESDYPGIKEQILRFENAILPVCSHCGSENTANVQVGIIGRTIALASATTKVKLALNRPQPGKYFCNHCQNFFD